MREKSKSPVMLSPGLGDDGRDMSGKGDVSLTVFITSVSGSKSLTSFTNRFFHFSGPPNLRLTFDAAERNGRFAAFSARKVKRAAAVERERDTERTQTEVTYGTQSRVITVMIEVIYCHTECAHFNPEYNRIQFGKLILGISQNYSKRCIHDFVSVWRRLFVVLWRSAREKSRF